jgi:hypothetical protein
MQRKCGMHGVIAKTWGTSNCTRSSKEDGWLGSTPCQAASSSAAILENNRGSNSSYYWVTNGTGHPHSVYCDMTRSCGGVTGGWMRVAYLDMTNRTHQCPSGLRQRTDSGVRSCAAYNDLLLCSLRNTWHPILQGVWKDYRIWGTFYKWVFSPFLCKRQWSGL